MALITERICCDFAASDGRVIPLVGDMMLELKESDGRARRFRKSLYDKGSAFEIFGVFRRILSKRLLCIARILARIAPLLQKQLYSEDWFMSQISFFTIASIRIDQSI